MCTCKSCIEANDNATEKMQPNFHVLVYSCCISWNNVYKLENIFIQIDC